MISTGLFMYLSVMLFFVIFVVSLIKDSGGFLILYLFVIVIVGMTNMPEEEEFYKFNTYDIHSTAGNYNQIRGDFYLGTGFINSQEMYTGNLFDGEVYERIYIPVADTKRKVVGYLTDKAIYKQPICKYKPTLFRFKDEFLCKHTMGLLEVPKGTIVKQLNFQ